MLRPLVLQQILDTILTPRPPPPPPPPSSYSDDSQATPHTALVVLTETAALYAASSRYDPLCAAADPSSAAAAAAAASPTGERPHAAFRGLLCPCPPSSSSSSSQTHTSSEERNRAIAVLACLAWRDRVARSTNREDKVIQGGGVTLLDKEEVNGRGRIDGLTVVTSQYGLLHIRPLLPSATSHRPRRSFPTTSPTPAPSTSVSPISHLGSLRPSPTSLSQQQQQKQPGEEDGHDGVGDEDEDDDDDADGGAAFLLVLNGDATTTTTDKGAADGSASDSAATMEQRGARMHALGHLVATSLAPSLRRLDR